MLPSCSGLSLSDARRCSRSDPSFGMVLMCCGEPDYGMGEYNFQIFMGGQRCPPSSRRSLSPLVAVSLTLGSCAPASCRVMSGQGDRRLGHRGPLLCVRLACLSWKAALPINYFTTSAPRCTKCSLVVSLSKTVRLLTVHLWYRSECWAHSQVAGSFPSLDPK